MEVGFISFNESKFPCRFFSKLPVTSIESLENIKIGSLDIAVTLSELTKF